MKRLFKLFKSFAKLINIARLFVVNSLFFVILLIIIVAFSGEEQEFNIDENSVLQLNFNGHIVEQKQPVDFSAELSKQMLGDENQYNEYPLTEVLQVISHAKDDPKIKQLLLDISGLQGASLNHINSIGVAINEFKSAGKQVIATADNYSQTQYLLASYADKIYLDPQGMILLQGFSVYRLYFKELLDNLLITPHVFKVGTFKSFVEPFTEKEMSSASKEANTHWLEQLWQAYIDTVLTQRSRTELTTQSLSPTIEQLTSALEETDGDTAQYALNTGLVDQLIPRYRVLTQLEKQQFKRISYADYQGTMPNLYEQDLTSPLIALIHGQGEILSGNQTSNAIGGDSFSKLLEKALINKRVQAVVIRLDTPGGSAFASEKIRQHILDLKKAGKIVVVSMGSVSASGGYWIASAADFIIAEPTTLTGSIGIFGMYATADKALEKLGIYNDGVGTTPLSSLDPTRPLDPALSNVIQLGIERGYKQFLTVVSEGRNMSVNDVDKVAQGRVWTGLDAKALGLVDNLGSLNDAITQAAMMASLDDYRIKPISNTLSTKQQLINEILLSSVKAIPQGIHLNPIIVEAFFSIQSQTTLLNRFNDPRGQYVYCPMCFMTQ